MNEKDIHNIDQSMEDVVRHLVPMLKGFYNSCIKEGFTPSQAIELTKTFMTTGSSK